jgi:RimJ/RimL family protein N-acetyltransferase
VSVPPGDDVIRFEPLGPDHLDELVALGQDPEVQRFTRLPVPWPEGFERAWLARYEEGRRDQTRLGFALVDAQDGRFCGMAGLVELNLPGRQAEAGYMVAPPARGRGLALRALRLLTAWAFAELDLVRIELVIDSHNAASLRIAAQAGYTQEGVLRSAWVKQDLRADASIWSRLASDPG